MDRKLIVSERVGDTINDNICVRKKKRKKMFHDGVFVVNRKILYYKEKTINCFDDHLSTISRVSMYPLKFYWHQRFVLMNRFVIRTWCSLSLLLLACSLVIRDISHFFSVCVHHSRIGSIYTWEQEKQTFCFWWCLHLRTSLVLFLVTKGFFFIYLTYFFFTVVVLWSSYITVQFWSVERFDLSSDRSMKEMSGEDRPTHMLLKDLIRRIRDVLVSVICCFFGCGFLYLL